MHTVTAVIPAYNEGARIRTVLETVRQSRYVTDIVVIDDGSTDDTTAAARACGIRVERLAVNSGKGTALRAGAIVAQSDVLLFLDADLIGLTPAHVDALAAPVATGTADMTIGIFRGGRAATDLAQVISPNISGQRCLTREFFLSAPLVDGSRSGVEIAMTVHARACKLTIDIVPLDGATHVMKEEKLGLLRGAFARWRMYLDIVVTLMRYYITVRHPRRSPAIHE